jgi:regulation of enolase protein 1 (concanavalin A-like superfamily)
MSTLTFPLWTLSNHQPFLWIISRRAGLIWAVGCCVTVLHLLLVGEVRSAKLYTIRDIGLIGAEQTRNDGVKYSYTVGLNEAGQLVGQSRRYNGGFTQLGFSAWIYNNSTTVAIGLVDAAHTRSDGTKVSGVLKLNEAGKVTGNSNRYSGNTQLGASAWIYNGASTVDIGLIGAEHTSNTGSKSSSPLKLNEAGEVVGSSARYNGGSAQLGQSIWLYNGTSTINIGLTGTEYTRNDGYENSSDAELNEAGYVAGYSSRYNGGSSNLGQSVWLYNGTTTLNVGLTGLEYTDSSGDKASTFQQLNDAGQLIGNSYRYNGSTGLGQSAWLYDGAATLDIGLAGSQYTRSDGYKVSNVVQLNNAGQVTGDSSRFNGSSALGQSAWFYNGLTTVDIGLIGIEHTRSDGTRTSYSYALNQAGQAIGYSNRYTGTTDMGQSAWIYNGLSTSEIGLTGAEYTRNDGYRASQPASNSTHLFNEAGGVTGYTLRYNGGSTQLGFAEWLYNGATTVRIGLTGPEYTRNDGYQSSDSTQLSQAGQVIGNSNRYNSGSTQLGASAWVYNGTDTVEVGLTGIENTRNDGFQGSVAENLNELGQVTGYSLRYNGGSTQLGQDAWVYDPIAGATVSLHLSQRSDGYAHSSVQFFGKNGEVFGNYELYSGNSLVGLRVFYWSRDDGLHDLGDLVAGGLTASGWAAISNVVEENGLQQFIGEGRAAGLPNSSSSKSAYLLTPAAAVIPGDFNSDGVVDAADYVFWRKNGGDSAAYDAWRAHFGQTVGSGSAAGTAIAVPEPSTISISTLGLFAALRIRRRIRRTDPWAVSLALIALSVGTARADTVGDMFDASHNYQSGNVAGTIWSGVLNADLLALGDANILNLGSLTWSAAANTGWEGSLANGPVLFRTISGDFDVSVQVVAMTKVWYSDGGLIVRVPDVSAAGSGEDYIALRYFAASGFNFNATRSTDNGVTTNVNYNALEPYLRMTRNGSEFRLYTRDSESSPWSLRHNVNRPDMGSVADLQVGLWFGTFLTNNVGSAQFDNFLLLIPSIPEPSTSSLIWLAGSLLLVMRRDKPRTF